MSVNTGTAECTEEVRCVLADLMTVVRNCEATRVLVGGDFNFNFASDVKAQTLFELVTDNLLVNCDDILEVSSCSLMPPLTFRRSVEQVGTFIDHFCVTRNVKQVTTRSYSIDSGDNLSDHLPVCNE